VVAVGFLDVVVEVAVDFLFLVLFSLLLLGKFKLVLFAFLADLSKALAASSALLNVPMWTNLRFSEM
jgi:hypothetical protein